ncbi:MAG: hypothetical protein RL662_1650 [Bacteroidota bacterium]|jgi:sugar lactone lactonase YvrE
MNNKRINLFFIIVSFVSIYFSASSQSTKDWFSHISYSNDITKIVQVEDKVYALTDGKLFAYNHVDESIEEYIKSDGGNTDITHIAYSSKHKCLVITRSDANIELLYQNGSYKNILDLKDLNQNIVKTINNIFIIDDFAYLATEFGFLMVDIARLEVKESGEFNIPFYSICLVGNMLYAATNNGVLTTDISSNIKDFENWKNFPVSKFYTETDYPFKDSDIKEVVSFKNKLHFLIPDRAVYIMDTPSSVKTIQKGKDFRLMYLTASQNLFITSNQTFWEYEDLDQTTSININYLKYIIPNNTKTGEYWLSSGGNNLSLIKKNESDFEYLKRWVRPLGPVSNYPFSQTYQNNQLMVTGGRFYTDRFWYPASISVYKNQRWSNIEQYKINEESGINALDIVYAISNPKNPNHIFASSWGEGLYEFLNETFIKRHDESNSTIEPIILDDFRTTRVSGMTYDKDNNLWLLNSMVKNTIKVYTKNGEWTQLYYPEIDAPLTNPKNIIIDPYSNKWITCFAGDNYLFIFNDNGTIANSSDDKYRYINEFFNESNASIEVQDINHIVADSKGRMWVSTNIGPFTIANVREILNTKDNKIQLTRIRIAKDTDNNTFIGLLDGVAINSIAIDGAGRKWIATQSAGVYLLDASDTQIEKHFTVEDSPLPSNNILSLSIDSDGIVYFGSDRGLMAYNGRVTEPSSSFDNVYVYPNPVKPDYTGLITVTGLKNNSNVKITDLKGNLIVEGRSLGGQFIWDGFNHKRKRVDTGIYLVFGASEDGTEGVVTKIMIVN